LRRCYGKKRKEKGEERIEAINHIVSTPLLDGQLEESGNFPTTRKGAGASRRHVR
jgi:hypothetical protein